MKESAALVRSPGGRGMGVFVHSEEGRGSTGHRAGESQVGATSRLGQQKTDRRWSAPVDTGQGETVR